MDAGQLWNLWSLSLTVSLGAVTGSFLNVVIYRMARNLPLMNPLWSFCPHCHHRIRFYDNIPVISYFRLGGRCRDCGGGISPRYVVIEVLTTLVFLLLFDAFFVANVIEGVRGIHWGLLDAMGRDWPYYLAHAILFTCLLAMSVSDIEEYSIDIRISYVAAIAGFVLFALWTPSRLPNWAQVESPQAAGALLATIAAVITHLISNWAWHRTHGRPLDEQIESQVPSQPVDAAPVLESRPDTDQNISSDTGKSYFPASAWLAGLLLYISVVWMIVEMTQQSRADWTTLAKKNYDSFVWRMLPVLLFAFLALMRGVIVRRPADQEIADSLEQERYSARTVVLKQGLILTPTAVVFVLGFLVVQPSAPGHDVWQTLWHWRPAGSVSPIMGLGTAAYGFIISGAIGWFVRIFFTLIFQKEALGEGDIYIMAAVGAVAGWQVVVLGFFLSSILGLIGWLLTLPFKSHPAIPMVPWLALAYFILVLFRDPVVQFVSQRLEPVTMFFK